MQIYNGSYYGGEATSWFDTVSTDFGINGFEINPLNYCVYSIEDSVGVDLNLYKIPRSNGSGYTGYYKYGRKISLGIYIKGTDAEDFQTKMDDLRRACFNGLVNIDKKVNGVTRRIRGFCEGFPENYAHYNKTFLRCSVDFISIEPFWYELGYQNGSYSGRTANISDYVNNDGTDVTDPVAHITFNSASSVSQIDFSANGKTITYSGSISASDTLELNSELKKVFLNGSEVDWDGEFPEFFTGINDFTLNSNGTFNMDAIIINRINYV